MKNGMVIIDADGHAVDFFDNPQRRGMTVDRVGFGTGH